MRLLARRLAAARTTITQQNDEIRELKAELTHQRRQLRLSEEARASLDEQIRILQAANEADARAAYTRRWVA